MHPLLTIALALTVAQTAASPVEFDSNYAGIGLSSPSDYERVFIFADAMKASRIWLKTTAWEALPASQVDSNGWPLTDAQILVATNQNMSGRYLLSFEGTGNASFTSSTISNTLRQPHSKW